jgi:hypothetical protein
MSARQIAVKKPSSCASISIITANIINLMIDRILPKLAKMKKARRMPVAISRINIEGLL